MASHSHQPSVQPRQLRPPEPVSIATPLPPSHPTQLFTPAFAAAQLVTGPDPLQHVTIPATQMATIPATSAGVQLVVWAVSHGPSANLAGSQRREIPFIDQEDVLGIDPRIRLETVLVAATPWNLCVQRRADPGTHLQSRSADEKHGRACMCVSQRALSLVP